MNTSSPKRHLLQPCDRIGISFDDHTMFAPETHANLILAMCEDVGSCLALKIKLLLNSGDIPALLSVEVNPNSYFDSASYFKDASIVALIKKYPFWSLPVSAKLTAMKTFIDCEVICEQTNTKFWNGTFKKEVSSVNSILAIAQRKISSILGVCPDISDLSFEFGPGATYSVKNNTSALDKLHSKLDVTRNCYGLAEVFLRSCPGWKSSDFIINDEIFGPPRPHSLNVVLGDRLSFVPKNAKTDRPIGIGPLLNGLIQKGVGSAIRRKLDPILSLRYAQDRHRSLALASSMDGRFSTIDLKSASDTIAIALVQDLLPPDWFELMDKCRSHSYSIEGKWYNYRKFSAMGNGFTFELETLIFYSIVYASCVYLGLETEMISVYGDDIITPTASASLVIEVLSFCGFSTNSDKTFVDGPFRESCGGDYFCGFDVRPFYLKDRISYRSLFLMHNFYEYKGFRFYFPKFFRLIRRLLGKKTLDFYKSGNYLDDGSLFHWDQPLCSYNSVVASVRGVRRSHKLNSFGVSYALYKLQFYRSKFGVEDVPLYKTDNFRVKYRVHRHVHI